MIFCMFMCNYGQFFIVCVIVGVGEIGYGLVGVVFIVSLFFKCLCVMLMGVFFVVVFVGLVLGVLFGGVIVVCWGWQVVFGVVGVLGLLLVLFYVFVLDYKMVVMVLGSM